MKKAVEMAGRGRARKTKSRFPSHAHSPWKSLRDSHIPTAMTSNGKVENQKQVSHFPTAYGFLFSTKFKRRPGGGASLLLQAHRSIRKCFASRQQQEKA